MKKDKHECVQKIYCELCSWQKVCVEEPHYGINKKDGIWGDILCSRCHLVIGTVTYSVLPHQIRNQNK